MKRILPVVTCLALSLGAIVLSAPSASAAMPKDRTVYFELKSRQSIDLGQPGPSAGDLSVASGEVTNSRGGKVIGTYDLSQVVVGMRGAGGRESRSMSMQIAFPQGKIEIMSTYSAPAGVPVSQTVTHAIVGGTGIYAGWGGSVRITALDADTFRVRIDFVK